MFNESEGRKGGKECTAQEKKKSLEHVDITQNM